MNRLSFSTLITLFVLGLLAGCDQQSTTVALGTLERDAIRLTAPATEIITARLVEEGQQVTTGTPLLQLDDRSVQLEVKRQQANVDSQYAYWQQLQNGPRPEDIQAAQARLQSATAMAQQAQLTFERRQALVSRKLLGQAELDQAIAERDSSHAAMEEAGQQLALLQHGSRQEQIDQAHAQWQAARESLALAHKQLEDLTITATRAGTIDSLPWQTGERVNSGTTLVVMLADAAPYVRAYIPESVRATLRIGQPLIVTVDGISSPLQGHLAQIQSDPAFTPHYALTETERSRLMYLAKIQLGSDAAGLPSGLPAQVMIPRTGNSP